VGAAKAGWRDAGRWQVAVLGSKVGGVWKAGSGSHASVAARARQVESGCHEQGLERVSRVYTANPPVKKAVPGENNALRDR